MKLLNEESLKLMKLDRILKMMRSGKEIGCGDSIVDYQKLLKSTKTKRFKMILK